LVLTALVAVIGVAAVLQVGKIQPRTITVDRLSDGTIGKVILDRFACAENRDLGFVEIDLAMTWTEATLQKVHSTLLHLGRTETNGIRLDLGQSTNSDGLSYYLIVGIRHTSTGYRVSEFPLDRVDYGLANVALSISKEVFKFKLETPSNREFIAEGPSSQVSCEYIYLGEGPPGLVPGYTDIALYPSETRNSSIVIKQGENLTVSRFYVPNLVMMTARWISFLALIVTLLFLSLRVYQKCMSMRLLSILRSLDPATSFLVLSFLLWTLVIPTW
jgi:hypothetical protein